MSAKENNEDTRVVHNVERGPPPSYTAAASTAGNTVEGRSAVSF